MKSAGDGEKFALSAAKINKVKTCPNREQYDAHRTQLHCMEERKNLI